MAPLDEVTFHTQPAAIAEALEITRRKSQTTGWKRTIGDTTCPLPATAGDHKSLVNLLKTLPYRYAFRSTCVVAFVLFLGNLAIVRAQEPNIDKLLKKLPPPEKLVKPSVAKAIRKPDPISRDPLVGQIESALNSNNVSRALELSRKLAATHPTNGLAHCLHGLIAIMSQQLGEASKALHEAARLEPNFASTYLGLATIEAIQQHYAAAVPHLRKLVQLEPNYVFGRLALIDCLLRTGHKQEAVEAARKTAAIAPSSPDAWLQLARAERESGNMQGALRALTRGAEVSPDSAEMLATVGFGYINMNRIREAIPPLERAVRLAPRDFLVHAQLGYCLQAVGQVDAGIQHLRTATSLAPKNYGPVWEHLGLAYQRKGMHAEAVRAFEHAVQIMPNYRPAWQHLALEYRALGRTADASQAEAKARSASGSTMSKHKS